MGALIKKIHRQDEAEIRVPPISGPAATATAPRPDQAPIARPRSAGANEASKIARLPGARSAAPAPCSTRATIRNAAPGASPHAAEATANQTTPIKNIRRLPNRSPSAPPISRNAASVRA